MPTIPKVSIRLFKNACISETVNKSLIFVTSFIFADHSDIKEDVHPGPATVDNVASPQPHEDYEHHEVAMVVVTDAVKHPGFEGQRSRNIRTELLAYTQSNVAQKLLQKNFSKKLPHLNYQ